MATSTPLRDARLALSLLTAIRTPARWPDEGATQVAGWFPVVGLLVGAVGYGIVKIAELLSLSGSATVVLSALVVIAWALMTRLLHWDGLADVADGYWGSPHPARRLEIMSDSRTGAFGAAAVALIAILEVAAIAAILAAPHELPLLVVPVFARFSATAAAWLGKPARAGGLGRSVMGAPTVLSATIVLLTLAVAFLALWSGFGVTGVALGSAGVVLALGVPHVLALRFGGVTGDVMGASVLLTEAVLFAGFALVV